MIKGIFLGMCMALFAVSLIVVLSGVSGNLGPNIITGQAIGEGGWMGIGVVGLVLSFIIGLFITLRIRKSYGSA